MDPPLVLICIDRKIVSHESLEKTDTFGVNICNSEQGKLAWDFASSKIDKNELIKSLPHTLTKLGTPLLEGCLATMECTIHIKTKGGSIESEQKLETVSPPNFLFSLKVTSVTPAANLRISSLKRSFEAAISFRKRPIYLVYFLCLDVSYRGILLFYIAIERVYTRVRRKLIHS
jgi:hypothetical protein